MNQTIYPIGIQNFEKIRKDGYLYVDKTALFINWRIPEVTTSSAVPDVSGKACYSLLWKPISKGRKSYSKDWRSRIWRKSGWSIPSCIWI